VPVIVTRSHYFPDAAAPGVLAEGPSLGSGEGWRPAAQEGSTHIGLDQLRRWRAAHGGMSG